MSSFLNFWVSKIIVENTPLVSGDISLVRSDKILFGKRNNVPLKEK